MNSSESIIVYSSPADKAIKEATWNVISGSPVFFIFLFIILLIIGSWDKFKGGSKNEFKRSKIKVPARKPYRRPPLPTKDNK